MYLLYEVQRGGITKKEAAIQLKKVPHTHSLPTYGYSALYYYDNQQASIDTLMDAVNGMMYGCKRERDAMVPRVVALSSNKENQRQIHATPVYPRERGFIRICDYSYSLSLDCIVIMK